MDFNQILLAGGILVCFLLGYMRKPWYLTIVIFLFVWLVTVSTSLLTDPFGFIGDLFSGLLSLPYTMLTGLLNFIFYPVSWWIGNTFRGGNH